MDRLRQDLVDAWRQWRRTPFITAVALLSLALGIGANLALFALVDALLLRTLPVRDPHTLVRVVTDDADSRLGPVDRVMTTRVWEHIREAQPFAGAVFALATDRFNLAPGGEARYVTGLYVSGEALDVLGVRPALGRVLQPADDVPGAAGVAMIGHGLWRREYSGHPGVLGETVWLDQQPFTIVGVAPPGFFGIEVGRRADVIIPVAAREILHGHQPNWEAQQTTFAWLAIYGRLAPGQTVEQASAALEAWRPALREATLPPGPAADRHLAQPLGVVSGAHGMSWLRRQYQEPMLILLGAVAVVLLIACANLAALVLARFTDRRSELGVRLALGATRGRLVRALLTESVVLAGAGAALGVWVAQWLVAAVTPYLTSPALRGLPPVIDIAVDARLVGVAALLALVSAAVAGIVPAWRASNLPPQTSLAATTRQGLHGARAARAMRWMVAAQVALSLVLIAGAALLVRSFVGLVTAPTGVEPDRVLVAAVGGNLLGDSEATRFVRLEEAQRALSVIPGVESVSAGIVTPLSGGMAAGQLRVPGSIYEPPPDMPAGGFTPFNRVLPGFFRTVGTPVIRGREFDERDGPGTPPVAVVNEAFARRHFGDADPVGRIIVAGTIEQTIVGVVADSRQMSLREEQPVPMAFGLLTQGSGGGALPNLRFVLRTATPDAVRPAVVTALRGIDPRLAVEFRTMRDEAEASVNRERVLAWLGGLFAVLGLTMAVVGLYGTFTYAVVRRRAEMGVRMALGARRADILRLVLRDALVVLAAGIALGAAGALAAGRLIESLLFGVSARDPWMLAAAVAGIALAAFAATAAPAVRAARVDPVVALREE